MQFLRSRCFVNWSAIRESRSCSWPQPLFRGACLTRSRTWNTSVLRTLTPFGSLSGSGSTEAQISDFGNFCRSVYGIQKIFQNITATYGRLHLKKRTRKSDKLSKIMHFCMMYKETKLICARNDDQEAHHPEYVPAVREIYFLAIKIAYKVLWKLDTALRLAYGTLSLQLEDV